MHQLSLQLLSFVFCRHTAEDSMVLKRPKAASPKAGQCTIRLHGLLLWHAGPAPGRSPSGDALSSNPADHVWFPRACLV